MTMNHDRTDAAAIYALFATGLVNAPDDEVRTCLAQLLAAGAGEAQPAAEPVGDLEQRFYDRFVIGVSPLYLPPSRAASSTRGKTSTAVSSRATWTVRA